MAARNLSPVRTLVRELVPIAGSFAPNGSFAVSASSRKGLGWSVARTSKNVFTITFTDKWADLVSAQAHLQLASTAVNIAQVGTYDATAKTLVISLVDATTGNIAATDVAANANNRVSFVCWFRNSAALPVRG